MWRCVYFALSLPLPLAEHSFAIRTKNIRRELQARDIRSNFGIHRVTGIRSNVEIEIRSNPLSVVSAMRSDIVMREKYAARWSYVPSHSRIFPAAKGVDTKNFPRISLDSLPHACILHLPLPFAFGSLSFLFSLSLYISLFLPFTHSSSRARWNKITPTCRTRAAGSPSPCWYRRKKGDRERPDWERDAASGGGVRTREGVTD